ncbi:hypothetical protein [Yersinia alsatica]|uniref:hypothetical protein n=1 Tax=Yersinia alsatica TaxID=2890317 RepID=UPI0005E02715|nr:hypothetical protein [Yersinia alsatica]CNH78854.1 Uncharacterised protein [Yersinia frederiksenii]
MSDGLILAYTSTLCPLKRRQNDLSLQTTITPICGTPRKLAVKYTQSFDNRRQFFRISRIVYYSVKMLWLSKVFIAKADVTNTNVAKPNSGARL